MKARRLIFAILLAASVAANAIFAARYLCGEWVWAPVIRMIGSARAPLAEDEPFAYRAYMSVVEPVGATEAGPAEELPDELVIAPGAYRVFGKRYELKKEGLYRFVDPGQSNQQRIVHGKDPDALLSGIAWIVSHGTADEGLSLWEMRQKALTGKLSLTCGLISSLAKKILQEAGIECRIVFCLTLDKWNSYDNGHTMIEVLHHKSSKYVLYDLDNNAYFTSPDGQRRLSLLDWVEATSISAHPAGGGPAHAMAYAMHPLAGDTRLDVAGFRSEEGFDWTFLGERTHADLHKWYRRVAQVPLIKKGAHHYFFNEADKDRIVSYNPRFRYIDKDQFLRRFYPDR